MELCFLLPMKIVRFYGQSLQIKKAGTENQNNQHKYEIPYFIQLHKNHLKHCLRYPNVST